MLWGLNMTYETQRLILRRWNPEDHISFSKMNADPRVMQYFPSTLSKDESLVLVQKIEESFEKNNFGFWAVERKDNREFIGFVGLNRPNFQADFTPCVEIGWRISSENWNRGYATEAALKAMEIGFDTFNLKKIYAFASKRNLASIRIMQKIGMEYVKDFLHPAIDAQSSLNPLVLYQKESS